MLEKTGLNRHRGSVVSKQADFFCLTSSWYSDPHVFSLDVTPKSVKNEDLTLMFFKT